jgi:hypothetical protein
MNSLLQTGLGVRMPMTPEKRFLIKYPARWHHFGVFLALCLLVVVQIVTYANYLFATKGIDTFVYSGFIASLPHHLQNFPNTYYGARLPWILPGYLLVRIFGTFLGLMLLNILFSAALGLSAYLWFYFLFGFRYGLLFGVVMICIPEVAYQATNHYVSLACSTYTLASLASIEASIQSSRTRFQRSCLLCFAGATIACAIMTNLVLLLFAPALISYYSVRSRGAPIREVLADVGRALTGFVAATLIYCLAYLRLTGTFNIFAPALRYLKERADVNPWCPVGSEWIPHAMWLILPALAALAAILFLFKRSATWRMRSKYLALATASLIAIASFICMQLLGTPLLSLSYYSCLLLPFCLGMLIALIGNISSLEECRLGMLLGALIAGSTVGVLLISSIFRELVLADGSISVTICSLAAGLILLAFWRPIRVSALVLLLLVTQSAFVRPNGDGRYYLDVPVLSKEIPEHIYDFKPLFCAPAELFSEYVRAHNYIYNDTRFRAPCFLIEDQPNDPYLTQMGLSVLSSYLYMYSMLNFSEAYAASSKSLLETRRYLAVLGNSAAWRDQQFQRARELVPGINFVFDSEIALHYKDRVLSLALYKISP